MGTKTLAQILEGFGEFTQQMVVPRSQFKGTADADGTVDALNDTELSAFADDYYNDDYWVYLTSGGAGGGGTGDIRNIEDFTSSGGVIAPDINFSGIPKSGATYQIWKCHVQDAIDAIKNALVSLVNRPDPRTGRKNKLYKKVIFESLGLSLLATDASSGATDVTLEDASLFFADQEVTIKDSINSTEMAIDTVNKTTNVVTLEDALATDFLTSKTAKVLAKSGHYFNLGTDIGNARVIAVYNKADATDTRKRYTNFEIIDSTAGDRQIYFPSSRSVDDQTWIIEAVDRLEEVDADTPAGTVTVEDEKVDLIYAEAAYHFYRRQSMEVSAGNLTRLRALSLSYRDMVDNDLRGLWLPNPARQETAYLGDI